MDLGTVSEKLGRGEYPTVIEAADDIELVWSNAMMYNGDDNWVHKAAARVKAAADKKLGPLIEKERRRQEYATRQEVRRDLIAVGPFIRTYSPSCTHNSLSTPVLRSESGSAARRGAARHRARLRPLAAAPATLANLATASRRARAWRGRRVPPPTDTQRRRRPPRRRTCGGGAAARSEFCAEGESPSCVPARRRLGAAWVYSR